MEKVAQTDEHHRELLVNDLEDVRALVEDLLASGGGGGSRDRSAPAARAVTVGAGESDELSKVTETVRRLNREQMAALASFVGEVRVSPSRAYLTSISHLYHAYFKKEVLSNLSSAYPTPISRR